MGGRRRLAQQGLATGVTDGFTNGGRDTHLYLCLEHCLDCHLRALHATEKPNHRVSAGRVDPPNTIERFSGLHCRGGGKWKGAVVPEQKLEKRWIILGFEDILVDYSCSSWGTPGS